MKRHWFLYALLWIFPACTSTAGPEKTARPAENTIAATPVQLSINEKIAQYAAFYDVPESLVHRIVKSESTYNPNARNGPYYGLMQILPATARTMGFRGKPDDLLDADINLQYGVKYLRGAWLLSNGSHDTAVKWYRSGYYYEAKRRGLLVETGLRPD